MKSVGICIETDSISMVEKLCEYIKIVTRLLDIKLVVLCNIWSFLTDNEIEVICKTASYEECNLLLLENKEMASNSCIKRYIIDKDGCEIFRENI